MNIYTLFALISFSISIIGIFLFIKYKRKKKITIFATEQLSTISVTEDIKPKIKIYFNDEKVEQIDRIEIIIVNKGNVTIDGTEIYIPIKVSVPQSSKILEHKILAQSKKHIEAKTESISEREIKFLFTLLKPKDKVRILILCSGIGQDLVEYSGRIIDLPTFDKDQIIQTMSPYNEFKEYRFFPIILLLFIFLTMLIINYQKSLIVTNPLVFPYEDKNSFRIFNICYHNQETGKGRIIFKFSDFIIKAERIDEKLFFKPALGIILDPEFCKKYIKTEEQKSQVTSLCNSFLQDLPVGIIERSVSNLDSSEIINAFGIPENITITHEDKIGDFSIEIETWKYKSKNIFTIISKYATKNEIVILSIFSISFILFLILLLYLINKLRYFYSILNKDERKKLFSDIKFLSKLKIKT